MKTVRATVTEIFASCPDLCGFSVQDAADLRLADVATLVYAPSEEMVGAIAGALLELVLEQPEAVDELRGRTFARTLH